MLSVLAEMCKHFSGGVSRPDLAACVTSGLFDLCIKAITAVAAAGVDGLQDTHHPALYYALSLVRICRAQPECEGKIRGTANALAFCLMNDLECVITLGNTTAAMAAQICENPCGAPARGEAHTKSSMLHRHICLTPSAAWARRAGCGVFGRDEGGSDFSFTSQHIENL
jgi:hypothetical protein